jgi:AcrR family transcriptional regulator
MSYESPKRKYELRKRADAMADTRQRITEAAMELHGTVGPARTTVSAVADRAGVQRHTVYRHFPTEDALYAACSAHFWATNPWPDAEQWRAIADPERRLETALDAIYHWYELTEPTMTNVHRDMELVEALPRSMRRFEHYMQDVELMLSAGWPARGARRRVMTVAIRHALDFSTWRSLVHEGGVSRAQAVRLASALVRQAAG